MTTTLEIKVWVKGGENTRSPDYYIRVNDSEYKYLLGEFVEAIRQIARTLEEKRQPKMVSSPF